jgi:hypothetical protein
LKDFQTENSFFAVAFLFTKIFGNKKCLQMVTRIAKKNRSKEMAENSITITRVHGGKI